MYGRDVALRAVSMVLILFVFIQLWTFTFAQRSGQAIQGLGLREIVWYLVLTETVVLSAPRVSQKIDEEVKSGDLAYVLTKPYNYVLYHLATYGGEAALRVPVNFGIGSALALAAVGAPPSSAPAVIAAAIAVLLGVTLNFLIEASIGLSAFWFEDSQPFFWIYQKLVFTVGGLFIPLSLLPRAVAAIASKLPFAAVTYAPARLFVGFSPTVCAGVFALQVSWLAVIAFGSALIYKRAVRKVNVHGG